MSLSLLVIDDDASIRETLIEFFETFGHVVRGAGTATEGRRLALEHAPDVVLLDLRLPDADGVVTLEALRADDPDVGVILLTGHADVRIAVQAMQKGAADVLEKPVDLGMLAAAVTRAAEQGRLRQELEILRSASSGSRTGSVPTLEHTLDELIALAARNVEAPVLLQGETGTGKGYVARQIHDRSARNHSPFIEINCASLSTTFFESELFGHERGAFTDARQAKRGLLEVAAGGSIFLDEIGEMSLDVQPRLLKVIEEHSFRRVGGTTTLHTDARVIVATHQPLAALVGERRFRADLFYRLQVLTITLPPLRAHPEALPELADRLLPRGARLGVGARDAIAQYAWPGNIRELKNALWRASILADGGTIEPAHLALPIKCSDPLIGDEIKGSEHLISSQPGGGRSDGDPTLEAAERRAIAAALRATKGNRTKAAQRLGIARSTLLEKLKRNEQQD